MEDCEVLEGLRCEKCDKIFLAPKKFCPGCLDENLGTIRLTGEGEVYSYTTIRVPPLGLEDQAPYDLLLIRLREGINITARVGKGTTNKPSIGDKVVFSEKIDGVYYFNIM